MKVIVACLCVVVLSFAWFGSNDRGTAEGITVQAVVPDGIAARIEGQGCSDDCHTQQLCRNNNCANPGHDCYVCMGGGYHKWCSGSGGGCTEWTSTGCGRRVKGTCDGANKCDASQDVGSCVQYDCS